MSTYKPKNLILLSIIFVCLAIFTFVYKNINKARHSLFQKTPYTNLDISKINRIEIKKKDVGYSFKKEDNKWSVVLPIECHANQDIVEAVLNNIKNLEIGEIVTIKPEKQFDFEVDDSTNGLCIFLYKGDSKEPATSFIIGKMAFDYLHYYFRYPGSNEIRSCKGLSRYDVDKSLSDWCDKTLLSVKKESIKKISLISKKGKIELVKSADKWQVNNEEADLTKVNTFLDKVSNFQANFVSNEKTADISVYGFNKPELQFTVEFDTGTASVLIGAKKDQSFYAKNDKINTIFLVDSFQIDNLKKIKNDFKK